MNALNCARSRGNPEIMQFLSEKKWIIPRIHGFARIADFWISDSSNIFKGLLPLAYDIVQQIFIQVLMIIITEIKFKADSDSCEFLRIYSRILGFLQIADSSNIFKGILQQQKNCEEEKI